MRHHSAIPRLPPLLPCLVDSDGFAKNLRCVLSTSTIQSCEVQLVVRNFADQMATKSDVDLLSLSSKTVNTNKILKGTEKKTAASVSLPLWLPIFWFPLCSRRTLSCPSSKRSWYSNATVVDRRLVRRISRATSPRLSFSSALRWTWRSYPGLGLGPWSSRSRFLIASGWSLAKFHDLCVYLWIYDTLWSFSGILY